MNTIRLFLSYARRNAAEASEVQRALSAAGAEVWRDQEALYAADRWPKYLGEAVA